MMETPTDFMDSPMIHEDSIDDVYPCKGCGDILEEGKAFELAGNRWHLNCFRCNTCGTLLDSDANLLLLGDGSLICNNCTYSCSACGNKIEDLAILTGDQAFCATCFRCRNCKRKIENLRYARTSQGIFCMSCHESLMARRRKKSRAAAQAKAKEKESMLVDKSLPALPPNALPQGAFSLDRSTPNSLDTETPTELSPRPRTNYAQTESSSRSSSRRPQSRDQPIADTPKNGLAAPASLYRNNRHSAISQASDIIGHDGEGFFIPLALDPGPAPLSTPRSTIESLSAELTRSLKDNKAPEKEYFGSSKSSERGQSRLNHRELDTNLDSSSPRLGFQEKGRQPSLDYAEISRETLRKPPAGPSRNPSLTSSPAIGSGDNTTPTASNEIQLTSDRFKLQEAPKNKKLGTSRSTSAAETPTFSSEVTLRSLSGFATPTQPPRAGSRKSESPQKLPPIEKNVPSGFFLDSRLWDDIESRPSIDPTSSSIPPTKGDSHSPTKTIPRKELGAGIVKSSITSGFAQDTSSSSGSPIDTPGATPTINGKTISGPVLLPQTKEETITQSEPTVRLGLVQQSISDSYMAPRAPPIPPPAGPPPPSSIRTGKGSISSTNGEPQSPKLPRWSAGGDFTMDEDMARILGGTDESSQSLLRRVSNAVRHGRHSSEASAAGRFSHGRSTSETTRATSSPRWPKTPIAEDTNGILAKDISSPISIISPVADDPALLRRQLRNAEQRVSELERQFSASGELKNVNQKLTEKRKTVSVLDSQAELMIRQIEALAGFVEKAKDPKTPLDLKDLEDSTIKDFVQKIDKLKQSMSAQIEQLLVERNDLIEEKDQATKDRDRALVEFEQLSSKNAQLADLNNDLTTQIQERFKAQSGNAMDPKPGMNGLGIYTHQNKDKSTTRLDDMSIHSGSTAVYGSSMGNIGSFQANIDQDSGIDPSTVLPAPHVVNIRKGQAKKFWKKGGATVAKGVSKGFKGAFSTGTQERTNWQASQADNIGMPYNMTVAHTEFPSHAGSNVPRTAPFDPRQGGFGLFKKSASMPKTQSNGSLVTIAAEHPSSLFGSELVERADFERRQIPSVVTRCIEEVELRGMTMEGIYRKTGGNSQVKSIQEGFEKIDDYDISDPDLDITAVTSVLKQYFRKLPTPLITFEIYESVLDAMGIEDEQERCVHLRLTFNKLPPKHRDCLEFLVFHLARVVKKQKENLMGPKNIAVVFAPTIMRDQSIDREMTDMQARNDVVQFVVENSDDIFGPA